MASGSSTSRPNWSMSVIELLLGKDPARRAAMLDQLVWLPLYVATLGVIWLGVVWAVIAPTQASIQTSYALLGFGTCIALLRFGNLSSDRLLRLGYGHTLFGVTCIALAYGLFQPFRMLAIPMLCVVLVSDLRKYTTRQLRNAAMLGLTLMLFSVPVRLMLVPKDIVTRDETMALGSAAVILGVVAMVMRKVKRMRAQLDTQQGELAQTLNRLHELATKDSLTNLLNRREMTVMLEDEIRRQQRMRTTVCVAMLDIDQFKRINDTYGHAVGDVVLYHFAQLVKASLLPVELLARWGGEEFLLLAPGVEPDEAEAHLAAARRAMNAYDWDVHAKGLQVNFSAGIAVLKPSELLEVWIEHADRMLYEAKANGRGCTVVAKDRGMNTPRTQPDAAVESGKASRAASSSTKNQGAHFEEKTLMPLNLGWDSSRVPGPSSRADGLDVPRTRAQRLRDLVLGADPDISSRSGMPLVVAALYFCTILVVQFLGLPSGEINPSTGRLLSTYALIGMVAFYPWIRSGITQRLDEPGLSLPQIMYGSTGAVILYHMFPSMRVVALQVMCLSQIFGLVRLRPLSALIAGIGMVAILLASIAATASNGLLDPARRVELTVVGFEAVILLTLAIITLRYSRLRSEVARQGHQLAEAVEKLRHIVTHDALTGLYNRQRMHELLEREMIRSAHFHKNFSVALIDLDHFKKVNDTHGHRVGDAVLCGFAKTARDVLRNTDVIARWGGEEFLALFPETEPSVACQTGLLRLAKTLAERHLGEQMPDVKVTFSAGVAIYKSGESIAAMLERADKALYSAKSDGRNRCVVAD